MNCLEMCIFFPTFIRGFCLILSFYLKRKQKITPKSTYIVYFEVTLRLFMNST